MFRFGVSFRCFGVSVFRFAVSWFSNVLEAVDDIEFQRIHRIGKRSSSDGKPRQIIARFLRYPDRVMIMSNARKLKGKRSEISADLPKEIMERRKRKMQQYKKAKADGKQAFFSRAEPDKLFIGGVQV